MDNDPEQIIDQEDLNFDGLRLLFDDCTNTTDKDESAEANNVTLQDQKDLNDGNHEGTDHKALSNDMNTKIKNHEDMADTTNHDKEEAMNTTGTAVENYSYDNITTVVGDIERSSLGTCIIAHACKNIANQDEGVVYSTNDFDDLRDEASDESGNYKGDVCCIVYYFFYYYEVKT